MSRSIRTLFNVAVVSAAVGLSTMAFSAEGLTSRMGREAHDRSSQQRAERSAPSRQESRPAQQSQSQQRSAPARGSSEGGSSRNRQPRELASDRMVQRPSVTREAPPASAPAAAPAREERSPVDRFINNMRENRGEQRVQVPPASNAQPAPAGAAQGRGNDNRGNDNRNAGNSRNAGGGDRGLTGSLINREYQTNNNRGNDRPGVERPRDNNGWDRDDRRNAWNDYDRRERERQWHRDHRPGRVINRLPVGYRDYAWGGSRYYYYGGSWYQPYGGTYISVGIPYGLFVTTLPGSYDSFWYGGNRYYYSDYNYYTYEPARRGYVVVESPYDDEDDARVQDLFIYPANGQSAQQQADDRYECHRWGVDQADYDPLDDEYDADLRADYLRAMTACLTGRGYTVK